MSQSPSSSSTLFILFLSQSVSSFHIVPRSTSSPHLIIFLLPFLPIFSSSSPSPFFNFGLISLFLLVFFPFVVSCFALLLPSLFHSLQSPPFLINLLPLFSSSNSSPLLLVLSQLLLLFLNISSTSSPPILFPSLPSLLSFPFLCYFLSSFSFLSTLHILSSPFRRG